MIQKNKIKIKLLSKNKTMRDLAKYLEISAQTLYRRFKKQDWRNHEITRMNDWGLL